MESTKEGVVMIEIFKTVNDELIRIESFEEGSWVNMVNPDSEEINKVCKSLKIAPDFIKAALDEEESPRIESEDGNVLIIIDTPISIIEENSQVYSTMPLGFILGSGCIVTVCLKPSRILKQFADNKVKSFYTFKKTRFILQFLYRNSTSFLHYLRQIDKLSSRIENDLHKSMKNKELIQLLNLEKSLVYFSTSLKSNEIVLEKMLKFEEIKKYPEDTDLLEDVIVENKQAIEMANIYSSILSGTMDAFASVISNNLNIVMKFLTSVTIVMAIPTMVASLFGMNVTLPMQKYPYAFTIILFISIALSVGAVIVLARRKMF
jgi:magnesium transporter